VTHVPPFGRRVVGAGHGVWDWARAEEVWGVWRVGGSAGLRGYSIPGVGCGSWSVGCGGWDVGCGVWCVVCGGCTV
jgi:hypothetical protein